MKDISIVIAEIIDAHAELCRKYQAVAGAKKNLVCAILDNEDALQQLATGSTETRAAQDKWPTE